MLVINNAIIKLLTIISSYIFLNYYFYYKIATKGIADVY